MTAPEPIELKRLFAAGTSTEPSKVRIVETSARGLDVSELGLRSISVRRHSIDTGYFDLAEASQIPTSIEGYSPLGLRSTRRRLSLSRSSVADATNQFIPVKDYVEWARTLSVVMSNTAIIPHAYFNRFAKEVAPLDKDAGAPKSILLDVRDLIPQEGVANDDGWDRKALEEMLQADTCLEIETIVDNKGKERLGFEFNGHTVEIEYIYRSTIPPAGRYQLKSPNLNDALTLNGVGAGAGGGNTTGQTGAYGQKLSPSLTRLLNAEQAFQIIPSSEGTVYSHGHFYRPDIDETLLAVLEGDASIKPAISEKGDTRITDVADWQGQTLFGLVEAWSKGSAGGALAADITNCDILICDDGSDETADFYAIDSKSSRVFIIHAKADKKANPNVSARKLQEVGRQAQASLALVGSARQSFPFPEGWEKDWSVTLKDAGKAIITRKRLWKSNVGTPQDAHGKLRAALGDPKFRTEVVVLTSGMLSAQKAIQANNDRSIHDLQFLYYLASLRSTFDRAGVRLRIVCNL